MRGTLIFRNGGVGKPADQIDSRPDSGFIINYPFLAVKIIARFRVGQHTFKHLYLCHAHSFSDSSCVPLQTSRKLMHTVCSLIVAKDISPPDYVAHKNRFPDERRYIIIVAQWFFANQGSLNPKRIVSLRTISQRTCGNKHILITIPNPYEDAVEIAVTVSLSQPSEVDY